MATRKYHLLGTFFCLFGIIPIVECQPSKLDEAAIVQLKQGISSAANSTQTIYSLFNQEKRLSMLQDRILTSGIFYFKKESNLRWEYLDPFNYIIVLRGNVITIKDGERVNVFDTRSNKVFEEVNRIIIGSVRGTLLDDPGFTALYAKDKEHYLVTLIPVTPHLKESLKEIVIHFNARTFSVVRLVMKEPGGDETTIRFYNQKINEPIPDATFFLQ